MTNTYRQVSRDATEVRYADPDAIFNTASVKVNLQPKKAGGLTVYNANAAMNIQRTITLPKPEGCTDSCAPMNQEKLALRFSLSGSTASKVEKRKLIADFRAWLTLFEEDMVIGFLAEVPVLTTTK